MPWTLISTRNETVQIARGGWLDALRFIVAFLIILHHFQAAGPAHLAAIVNPIFERGGFLLTNFFLIDSGYVLMRVYGAAVDKGRMSPGDFFLKRFLRVVPAHLIMGLSLVGLVVLSTGPYLEPADLAFAGTILSPGTESNATSLRDLERDHIIPFGRPLGVSRPIRRSPAACLARRGRLEDAGCGRSQRVYGPPFPSR